MLKSIISNKDSRVFLLLTVAVLFFLTLIASIYLVGLQNYSSVLIRTGARLVIPLVFLPFAGMVALKLPLFKQNRNLLFHFLLSLVFVALYVIALPSLMHAIRGENLFLTGGEYIGRLLLGQFLLTGSTGFILYWFVVMLAGLQIYYDEMNRMKTHSDELESQLIQANLSALKAQLKPHFLFNTLNMTDYMIYKDPGRAKEILRKLESLLKDRFDRNQQNSLPLTDEVATIQKYLEIEKTRFEDRLKVEIHIADQTGDLLVPTFILQPLVENSIKHGLNKSVEPCTLAIRSFTKPDSVIIEVRDNVQKIAVLPREDQWGVGLRNTKKRIKLFYGEGAKLNVKRGPNGGFCSQIWIPTNKKISDECSDCR